MNSLNQKKATKAAYRNKIARFSGVSLIQRGGLPLRTPRSLLLPLAILTLFNCEAIFDIYPPKIEIIEPQEGVSYFGTLPVELLVTDNNEVVRVEVFLDAVSVHEFTREPYKTEINLGGISARILKVVAHDRAGNWSDASQHISPLASTYDTPGNALRVFAAGNFAYVLYVIVPADSGIQAITGLQIINTSDPANPSLVGSYDMLDGAHAVFVSGRYAYVAAGVSGGLQVINISNPANPTLVGSYKTGDYRTFAPVDVFISGNYAYVAANLGGFQIIDISNPANPVPTGSYIIPHNLASSVFIYGNYAYVAYWDAGLQIISISNPASPVPASSYDTGSATDVFVSGGYAYVANGYHDFQIINISNPADLTLLGSYNTPSYSRGVSVSGNYAYVVDGYDQVYNGLQIIDVSNPASPTLASQYETTGTAMEVCVSGGYAYVAAGSSGLLIFDISGLP